ncbi:MAG: hypothetical protein H6706_28095 [Myxococcales bacterium]|nr:hypothetical protein [Myxococcales bacterium]
MRRLLILAALVQGGCFSGDDFSACTQVGQPCGRAQICVEPGVCAFVDAVDEGVVQDRGQRPDARRDAGTETLEFTEKLPPRLEADGADVALRTAEMEGASTLIQGARTIEVSQGIVADGRGSPGGGGGGGGAGATQGPAATGGAGGRSGRRWPAWRGRPGDGGDGAPAAPPGNARGGAGGTLDAPDGQPGDEGTFP